jgi:hypothetical protein
MIYPYKWNANGLFISNTAFSSLVAAYVKLGLTITRPVSGSTIPVTYIAAKLLVASIFPFKDAVSNSSNEYVVFLGSITTSGPCNCPY